MIGGIVNYYCSKILEYIKDRKIIRFFAVPQVCGVHVSIKQGKCIDTCRFCTAKMLVGVPPNPLALLATMKPLTKSPIRTYLGLDLLDRVPDHSTVSQLRWRKPSFGKSFRRLFEEIVRQCVPNGPVTGRLVGTDLCEGQCLPCLGGADGAPGEPRELLRASGHLRGGGAGGTGPVDRKTPFQTNQTAQKG